MSHIPSSAMPHAKAHDDEHSDAHTATGSASGNAPTKTDDHAGPAESLSDAPAKAVRSVADHPWLGAMVVGGALAIGAIAFALPLFRQDAAGHGHAAEPAKGKKKRKAQR